MIELDVTGLHKRFGGLHVLKGVSFQVRGPELIGLIGPNGAGKTTMTNILDGAIKPNSGTVYLNGQRIDQLQPYEVARAGLGRTFQVTRSFRRMTVLENLYVPALALDRAHSKAEIHDILGIPDHIESAAIIPLGWPDRDYGPNRRAALEQFVMRDRWNG